MFNPKKVSDFLSRYPVVRLAATKAYGFRDFNPNTHAYRFKSGVETVANLESQSYEIVFDAQSLQTPTRLRGVGRYAINFIVAYCNSMPNAKFLALLTNVAEKNQLEFALKLLREVAPENLSIQVIDVFQRSSVVRLKDAQQKLSTAISSSKSKNILIFDGLEKLTNRVPIAGSRRYKRIVILHDLIKKKFPDSLLPSNYDKSLFSYLFQELLTVDLVLSNSRTTSNDWFANTGFESPVIFGASAFSKAERGYPLSARSGILIISAEQPHKNICCAISAYASLPEKLRNEHGLTLVGIRASGYQKLICNKFKEIIPNIFFETNIADCKLATLYRTNRLVAMPSLAEGLGLPLLEAWNFGTVSIGSSGTVAEEILQNPDLMFNPLNIDSIARTMEKYLSLDEEWVLAQEQLLQIRKNFSWDGTVELAKEAIKTLDV